jgi:hypothetical protein
MDAYSYEEGEMIPVSSFKMYEVEGSMLIRNSTTVSSSDVFLILSLSIYAIVKNLKNIITLYNNYDHYFLK